MKKMALTVMAFSLLAAVGCKNKNQEEDANRIPAADLPARVASYAPFTLTTDVASLTDNERQLLPILIQIADVMDDLYWEQFFGTENRKALDTLSDP